MWVSSAAVGEAINYSDSKEFSNLTGNKKVQDNISKTKTKKSSGQAFEEWTGNDKL